MAGEKRRARLRALLRKAHARPADLTIFEIALVHESAARELRRTSNERLEFLGDAVLGFIAAEWLYERHPRASEGWLTQRKAAVVRDSALAATASRLGFSELVELGEGLARAGGSQNRTILADAFEAFVGALLLTYGVDRARRFLVEHHLPFVDLSEDSVTDPKSRLQTLTQERYREVPRYHDRSVGTAQHPEFASQVLLKDKILGSGTGKSKKVAQAEAAAKALKILGSGPGEL